mmetsp:Transcript_36007/g.84060  ORF Transcript_36007/g.84060 Transcript_36007/m.84060 type:complete len:409 (+) Transcript_36007:319-1545(+)
MQGLQHKTKRWLFAQHRHRGLVNISQRCPLDRFHYGHLIVQILAEFLEDGGPIVQLFPQPRYQSARRRSYLQLHTREDGLYDAPHYIGIGRVLAEFETVQFDGEVFRRTALLVVQADRLEFLDDVDALRPADHEGFEIVAHVHRRRDGRIGTVVRRAVVARVGTTEFIVVLHFLLPQSRVCSREVRDVVEPQAAGLQGVESGQLVLRRIIVVGFFGSGRNEETPDSFRSDHIGVRRDWRSFVLLVISFIIVVLRCIAVFAFVVRREKVIVVVIIVSSIDGAGDARILFQLHTGVDHAPFSDHTSGRHDGARFDGHAVAYHRGRDDGPVADRGTFPDVGVGERDVRAQEHVVTQDRSLYGTALSDLAPPYYTARYARPPIDFRFGPSYSVYPSPSSYISFVTTWRLFRC